MGCKVDEGSFIYQNFVASLSLIKEGMCHLFSQVFVFASKNFSGYPEKGTVRRKRHFPRNGCWKKKICIAENLK